MSMSVVLKSLERNWQARKNFIVPWTVKKISNKEYEHVYKVWNTSQMKKLKYYHNSYLKSNILLLADVYKILWIMHKSLFERASLKVGCNELIVIDWAWTYFRCWHLFIPWKRYERQIFPKDIGKPTIII